MFIDDFIGVQCSANIQRTMARWTSEIWWYWRWVKQTIIEITILRLYYKWKHHPCHQTHSIYLYVFKIKKSVKWTLFLIHNLFSCNAVTDISYRIFYVWTLTRKQKSFCNKKKAKKKKRKFVKNFSLSFYSFTSPFQGGKNNNIHNFILIILSLIFFFRGQKNI